jgi:predicted hydrolase (HD superfamily)
MRVDGFDNRSRQRAPDVRVGRLLQNFDVEYPTGEPSSLGLDILDYWLSGVDAARCDIIQRLEIGVDSKEAWRMDAALFSVDPLTSPQRTPGH